ncbi:MAG: hypothetical protein PF505_07400 [Vallitaleaceae bacterium]|jgi:quercetin dioxygenase-like cupin family protein|nr:hypothetical protein [Vallitaleaceae bacterium]
MVEKVYPLAQTEVTTAEKIIMTDEIHYIHLVLGAGEALDRHHANAKVHMNILRGTVTLELADQEAHAYSVGNLVVIPDKTEMLISNKEDHALEVVIVKAPGPVQA